MFTLSLIDLRSILATAREVNAVPVRSDADIIANKNVLSVSLNK